MTEQQERLARERARDRRAGEELSARRRRNSNEEREEYYKTTMANAWDGFNRPVVLELTPSSNAVGQ